MKASHVWPAINDRYAAVSVGMLDCVAVYRTNALRVLTAAFRQFGGDDHLSVIFPIRLFTPHESYLDRMLFLERRDFEIDTSCLD
jgi:hypothetical protein